jgi:hypothetical protein
MFDFVRQCECAVNNTVGIEDSMDRCWDGVSESCPAGVCIAHFNLGEWTKENKAVNILFMDIYFEQNIFSTR